MGLAWLRLPALIFVLAALGLAMAADVRAERLFAWPRTLSVAPVENAGRYEWRKEPGHGSGLVTNEPRLRVFEPWNRTVVWRVRALPLVEILNPAFLPSAWSDPSEAARWRPDPDATNTQVVNLADVNSAASMFGKFNCNGEWSTVQCSCTEGGPCPPP